MIYIFNSNTDEKFKIDKNELKQWAKLSDFYDKSQISVNQFEYEDLKYILLNPDKVRLIISEYHIKLLSKYGGISEYSQEYIDIYLREKQYKNLKKFQYCKYRYYIYAKQSINNKLSY